MKIIVCVKQVPDTTKVEIDPETKTLVRKGVESVLNPLDTFAVEEALRLRDQHGGSVTALSLGPPQAEQMLRETLAFGVDEAALVSGREFAGSDTWATSYALARATEHLGDFDLILCGKQAIDGDTAHVGPEMAVHLGLPQLTYVRRIHSIENKTLVAERLTDRGYQTVSVPLPAVLTVVKDLNEPRLPNLADLHRGRFARINPMGADPINADLSQIGLDGSPTRVVHIFAPDTHRAGRMFEENIDEGMEEVADLLEQEGLV
ncbi:MAG: electron transfer flavoprotein subunit beta/FixA family protein [Candidatus Brocadiia bacterium]